jgi:hypothetical protein
MVLGPEYGRLPDSIRQMLPLMPAPAANQLCPTLLNGVLGTCDLTAMVEYGLATALPEVTMPLVCKPAAQVGRQGQSRGRRGWRGEPWRGQAQRRQRSLQAECRSPHWHVSNT